MGKRKVRFVINVRGVKRELIAIRETKHGDLIILKKSSQLLQFGHLDQKLKEQRFSVHPSPRTEGITITQRLVLDDGTKADTYAHTTPRNGHIIWPLYAQASADLAKDHYITNPHKNDRTIEIGRYEPQFSTLLYAVIVTDRDANLRHALANPTVSVFTAKFEEFAIWIVATFINIPSTHFGRLLTSPTHAPRIDGIDILDFDFEVAFESWAISEALARTFIMLSMARDSTVSATREWLSKDGDLTADMEEAISTLSSTWSKHPIKDAQKKVP